MVVFSFSPSFGADIEVTCSASGSGDQDDMCIWLHPEDPALSTIIASDKEKSILFVYALDGETLYSYPFQWKPGNIDIIYNFPLNGELIDVVSFNHRAVGTANFVFYKVDKQTRELVEIGAPATTETWSDELYGFCLYKSPNNHEYYAFGCDKSSMIQQYRFYDDGTGNLAMEHKRTWKNGSGGNTEGMVADHEAGLLYAGNENEGIYVYNADPDMTTDPVRFLPVKTDTLAADVEGLTIYYAAGGKGYLLASSQGQSYFSVFNRDGENSFVRKFTVNGVGDTDGIDVLNVTLNDTFPVGIFACHNGNGSPNPVNLVKWDDIADDDTPGLMIDTTYWNPREALFTEVGQDYYANKIECSVYPNPFNNQTKICLELSEASAIQCIIFDVTGREVGVLADDFLQAGRHEFQWNINGDLKDDAVGIFNCLIKVNERRFSKKLIRY